LSGAALLLWALHMLVRDYIFAFTHGTTEGAMGLKVLGLTSSQYSVAIGDRQTGRVTPPCDRADSRLP